MMFIIFLTDTNQLLIAKHLPEEYFNYILQKFVRQKMGN